MCVCVCVCVYTYKCTDYTYIYRNTHSPLVSSDVVRWST